MRKFTYILGLMILSTLLAMPTEVSSKQKAVDPLDVDETRAMIRAVDERSESLNIREEKLYIEEARLKALKKDIDAKLTNLTAVTKKLEELLSSVQSIDSERIRGLAKLYESMPPEEAASTIEKVDSGLAVQILRRMSTRKSGKMMGFIDDRKAARLSEGLGNLILPEEDMIK